MIKIFDYTDYRKFLKDVYEFKKKSNKYFSYQTFATKAGFKTKTYLFKIINGQKALSKRSIFNVAHAIGLNKKETEYFEAMVNFNEAKTVREREHYFNLLQAFNLDKVAVKLRENQFKYFSNWYNAVIRELVTIINFQGDCKRLGLKTRPNITEHQADEALQLLLDLDLIKKGPHGRYVHTERALSTGDEVVSLAVQKFQKEHLKLADRAIDDCPPADRDISTLTVGISREGFEQIKSELQWFRKHLIKIVDKDEPADRIYQMNLQLFPLTMQDGEK
jgi:uncharacterized protein (TIGR02147 family)